jgi:hypothetical protein
MSWFTLGYPGCVPLALPVSALGASGTQIDIRQFILNTKTAWNRLVLAPRGQFGDIGS